MGSNLSSSFLSLCAVHSYPSSSWFLLRQRREKPLRATVCFYIEHAQARHAPRDAFYANLFVNNVFCWQCFGTQESKCIPKALTKERSNSHSISIIYLLSFYENDSAVLTGRNAFSPRLLCLPTVISAFYHCTKKSTKCCKGGVPLPFLGWLCL